MNVHVSASKMGHFLKHCFSGLLTKRQLTNLAFLSYSCKTWFVFVLHFVVLNITRVAVAKVLQGLIYLNLGAWLKPSLHQKQGLIISDLGHYRLLQQPQGLYNRFLMEVEGALVWLGKHQPLPTDLEMTQEIADQFDEIRKLFLMHSDSRCIPLFLNVFGGRNGWGMYQLVENVLRKYPLHEILPHLLKGLKSPNQYVRQWCAEIATNFPDPSLVSPLAALLADQDYDVKSGAIIALQQIQDMRVRSILEVYFQHEEDESLRELIDF